MGQGGAGLEGHMAEGLPESGAGTVGRGTEEDKALDLQVRNSERLGGKGSVGRQIRGQAGHRTAVNSLIFMQSKVVAEKALMLSI